MSIADTVATNTGGVVDRSDGIHTIAGKADSETGSSSATSSQQIAKLKAQVANLRKQRNDAVSVLRHSGLLLELPTSTLKKIIPKQDLADTYADQCTKHIEQFHYIRPVGELKENILQLASIEGNTTRVMQYFIYYVIADMKAVCREWDQEDYGEPDPEDTASYMCEKELEDETLLEMIESEWRIKMALPEPEMWDPTAIIEAFRYVTVLGGLQCMWDRWERRCSMKLLGRSAEFLYYCHGRRVGRMLARKIVGGILPPELVSLIEGLVVGERNSYSLPVPEKCVCCQSCESEMVDETSDEDSESALERNTDDEMVD
ncbi:hypothetical protein K431DRAFT_315885 [Polychaeton citri CBS 116435]|uniref:Uncharacterized protein n=1 Tax=Polychaeton citri CBS 116435 TaxID=1314669 RepID=A0A9P4Q0S6_9PEZI|nr:hypothetical protein K431DRAFT_315885 [Polychaeton citri CBS 116435]